MQPKLKILFIAYFFPPVNGGGIPGAMRILKFLRHLQTENYVLSQKSEASKQFDESICCDLPEEHVVRAGTIDPFGSLLKLQFKIKQLIRNRGSASVEKVPQSQSSVFSDNTKQAEKSILGKLKDFVYHLNYFPDQASVWILPAFLAGRRLIRTKKIDVIFATGSPWSSLILGYLLSKMLSTPLVVDFRDPWINNPFHHSKGKFLDRLAKKLEALIIAHASLVTLNTESLLDEFARRYPRISTDKFIVLPNGFDQALEEVKPIKQDKSEFVMRHTGFLYGPRDPSILLDAIESANRQAAELNQSRRWVFEQIGALSLNYDVTMKYQHMLADGSFRILPQIPYAECQTLLAEADLLVNIQPGTKTQVPSKLYDYLAVGRPLLNITPKDGALGQMVTKYGFGSCFDFDENDELARYLSGRLTDLNWLTTEIYPARGDFDIRKITERLLVNLQQIMLINEPKTKK